MLQNHPLIERIQLLSTIEASLPESLITVLLGAHQVGKTTLSGLLARDNRETHFFDLETAAGRSALSTPELALAPLKGLVNRLTEECGIVCAQVAVDQVEEVAFPNYVDLSAFRFEEAVARFGRLLIQLTVGWR